jgi:hypothetical protein
MKNIIDNLHRQHRELTKVTMQLVPLLDPARLQRGASDVRRLLRTLSGILHVHVSMEDRSFYPFLLRHRDEELRRVAEQYLAERNEIQGQSTIIPSAGSPARRSRARPPYSSTRHAPCCFCSVRG